MKENDVLSITEVQGLYTKLWFNTSLKTYLFMFVIEYNLNY